MNSFKKKLADFSELVMFKHSVFSLPFIFIAMLVAANGWFGWKLLILGALAAVSARNFAMGVNRYLDRDIDILNPRTKGRPSVDGRVSNRQMLGFIGVNALLFIVVAYFVNDLAFKLAIPILMVLGAYTLFKRFSAAAHLILGVSLGLAPIAGVVAVSSEITAWSVYLGLGVMFWVAGFDLLYSLQDMEFDKKNNLHSIPSRFGAKNTMNIAKVFHILAIVFWAWFVSDANLGIWGQLSVLFAALMLTYEHYLVNKDFTKIDRAFFTVNGYLGFVFLLFIILEVIQMEYILIGLVFILALMLTTLIFSNQKLKKEVKVLQEVLEVKDTTISDLEVPRVAVKEVVDHFSLHDEVMECVEAGESRESISEKLGIPANKIELIIKFDKIKKEKHV